jgi:hypothetical protein
MTRKKMDEDGLGDEKRKLLGTTEDTTVVKGLV